MDLHPLKRTAWILARGKAKKKMISPIKRYVGNNNKNCGNAKIGNLLDWTGVLKKKGEKKLSLPPCAQRPHLGNYNQEAVFFHCKNPIRFSVFSTVYALVLPNSGLKSPVTLHIHQQDPGKDSFQKERQKDYVVQLPSQEKNKPCHTPLGVPTTARSRAGA